MSEKARNKLFCDRAAVIFESISQSDKSVLPLKLQLFKLYDSYNKTPRAEKDAVFLKMEGIVDLIHEKERQLAVERKQREIIENAPRQEEARKRSAARIQAGEFSIWIKYDNEYRTGTPQELLSKGHHIWASDRTPITVDGTVCVGPRLGSYMGVNLGSILPGGGITRGGLTQNGVTYDGTNEPQLY